MANALALAPAIARNNPLRMEPCVPRPRNVPPDFASMAFAVRIPATTHVWPVPQRKKAKEPTEHVVQSSRVPILRTNASIAIVMDRARVLLRQTCPMALPARHLRNVPRLSASTGFVAIRRVPDPAKPVPRRKRAKGRMERARSSNTTRTPTKNVTPELVMEVALANITTVLLAARMRNVCPGIALTGFAATTIAAESVMRVRRRKRVPAPMACVAPFLPRSIPTPNAPRRIARVWPDVPLIPALRSSIARLQPRVLAERVSAIPAIPAEAWFVPISTNASRTTVDATPTRHV
jgi:hypothetical protein